MGKHCRINEVFTHSLEAVTRKKVSLKSEAKQPLETERVCVALNLVEQCVTDATTKPFGCDGERAHFGKVVPHDVEGTASDDCAVWQHGHAKLLHCFVKDHKIFTEQAALVDEWLNEALDSPYVSSNCRTNAECGHALTLPLAGV